jgi:uncharacterized protein YggE
MMPSTARWMMVGSLLGFAAFAPAWAQSPYEPQVNSEGLVTLKRQPEVLRLQIELLAKGQDLKEALSKLKARREAARAKLLEFGANEKSIEFSESRLSSGKSDQRRQMEMMIRRRLEKKPKEEGEKAKAEPITVGCTLTAEWPIKTQDADELLIFSHELEEKVKAADLGGRKDLAAKTPEEEEMDEETKQEMSSYSGEEGPQPGEPIFMFVARIPDDQRDKAMAEAFQKAKANAARLAKAAGAELGSLRSLSTRQQPDYQRMNRYNRAYGSYAYELMQRYSPEDTTVDEAIGMEPGPVAFKIVVDASFLLK